jgi:hypothetical protein
LGEFVAAGGAVFTGVEDHLEVEGDPERFGEEFFQVFFCLFDGFAFGEFPSFGASVGVGVDRKGAD